MGAEPGVVPEDTFFTYVLLVFVFPTAGHAMHTALRIRREESSGTAELMLAGPFLRSAWAPVHAAAGFLFPVALLLVIGIAVGTGSGLGADHFVPTSQSSRDPPCPWRPQCGSWLVSPSRRTLWCRAAQPR